MDLHDAGKEGVGFIDDHVFFLTLEGLYIELWDYKVLRGGSHESFHEIFHVVEHFMDGLGLSDVEDEKMDLCCGTSQYL